MATGTTVAIFPPTAHHCALVAQQTKVRACIQAARQVIEAFTTQAWEHDAEWPQPSTTLTAVHAGRLPTLIAASAPAERLARRPMLLAHAANKPHRMKSRRRRRTTSWTSHCPSGRGYAHRFRWGMARSHRPPADAGPPNPYPPKGARQRWVGR
jgi:hypothetical protein